MKMIPVVLSLLLISTIALAETKKEVLINFDQAVVDKTPEGFSTGLTGQGGPVIWAVQEDPTAPSPSKVLAQLSTERAHMRFPVCVYDGLKAKDVLVTVKFKPVTGRIDQAAGIVARYLDQDNYYIVRANALEGNVNLYKVVGGVRKEFAGAAAAVSSGQWQILGLEVQGTHFKVFKDEKLLFEADDTTFANEGKVGLWTKADSVTYFDNLAITPLK